MFWRKKKIRDAKLAKYLRNLPTKRLIDGYLATKDDTTGEIGVCAVGACLNPTEIQEYLASSKISYCNNIFYDKVNRRIDTPSIEVVKFNDSFLETYETPEERYVRILNWAEEKI